MKRWPTMPVAPRIPTGSLVDIFGGYGKTRFYTSEILPENVAADATGKTLNPGSKRAISLRASSQGSGSALTEFLRERVLVEWSKLAFFRVDAPPAPDNAQTGHHRNGEI